jgi:hypothetical protein
MADKTSRTNPETPNRHTHSPDNPQSWGQAGDLARTDVETMNGRGGGGDSGGGAYPNPHTGKEGSDREGFFGHGGQTEMPYHGGSQLGDQDVGGNLNSGAKKTKPGKSGGKD